MKRYIASLFGLNILVNSLQVSAQNTYAPEPNLYSGYIDIPSNKSLFWILAESSRDADTDPLLIWTNGGPGCSSLEGFLTEHGPFIINEGSSIIQKNQYSWNKFANVLYIEQPAGVGFSECYSPESCQHDDDTDAEDNLQFVIQWISQNPQFQGREVWLSGESYAGIYIPMLLNKIDDYNKNQTDSKNQINLQGMLVGNGVTNWKYDADPAMFKTWFYRGLISTDTWQKMLDGNCDYSGDDWNDPLSPICKEAFQEANQATVGFNPYSIYHKCWGLESPSMARKRNYTPWLKINKYKLSNEDNGINCAWDGGFEAYWNNKTVQKDMGINQNYSRNWSTCRDQDETWNYTEGRTGTQQIWDNKELYNKYRMLKYSGTDDSIVATIGTQEWIETLNRTVKRPWSEYKLANSTQIAGFWQEYEGLTFATIRSAGHMVPTDKPEAAFHVISQFMAGKPL